MAEAAPPHRPRRSPGGSGESSDNVLDFDQLGNSNIISGGLGDGSNNNLITVSQTGDANHVTSSNAWTQDGVLIGGNDNTMTITQDGMDNTSLNTIIGNGNTATVDQSDL